MAAAKNDAGIPRPSKTRNRIEPGWKCAAFDRSACCCGGLDITLQNPPITDRAKREMEPVRRIDAAVKPEPASRPSRKILDASGCVLGGPQGEIAPRGHRLCLSGKQIQ